jgi:serine/threonine protein kinase
MKYCPKCSQTFPREQRFCLEDGTILSLRDPYNLVGRTLGGRYRIDALIGVGGMGAVYNAFQLGPDRRVAFKILQPNLTLQNDQILRLFEGEAKMVGGLSHENIVIIYDAGRAEDSLAFIAMEWLEGQTLEEHISASSPLGLDRVANILKQFSGALETAHRMHIIHRDLKPTNVILARQVDGSERLKVLDFGIAKALGDATDAPVSQIIGTPHYASPEQLQVGEMIDTRSDIYSLGIILYRMITGRLPFVASSIRELIDLHLTAAPPPLRDLRPDLPSAIDKLILQMLDKDAARRPRTIREVNDSFQRALVARAKSASASVSSRSSRRAKQLLLWVDDQPQHNRALIERLRVSGWEIIETRSTAEALEALATVEGPFEMIISDMGRTEDATFRPYAGLELIEAAHAADYSLPIVIFSSPGRVKEMRERVSAVGGYGVTASADELFEMLSRRLEMRSSEIIVQPQVTVAPAFFPDLQASNFEVVTLGATGEVIERRTGEASYYVEDLGADITLDLVKIPAGSCVMGLEMPHPVSVPSFYMSRYTVTQDQWRRIAGYPKASIELNPSPSYFKGERRPVERISWEEAMEFCKR